jgi:hypothetical protein
MTQLFEDPGHTRADLNILTKSLVEKWEIPSELLQKLPLILGKIAVTGKPREQIAAAKNLMLMKQYNDEIDSPKTPSQTSITVGVAVDNRTQSGRDRLAEIAARLAARRLAVGPST